MIDLMLFFTGACTLIVLGVVLIGWVDTYQSSKIRSKRNHPTYKER